MKINFKKYIIITALCILAAQALPVKSAPLAQEETIILCSDFERTQTKI